VSHLRSFELADGRLIGYPDLEIGEQEWLDHQALKVAAEVAAGDEFLYTFDLGDDWRHRCLVLPEKVDPRAEFGPPPRRPVPIWGWDGSPTGTVATRLRTRSNPRAAARQAALGGR
jgi:hypothetical protein